jgi:hypothetical protein
VTGSGIEFQVTNTGVRMGNATTDVHPITGSVGITGSLVITGSTGILGTLTVTSTIDNTTGTITTNRVTIPNNGGNSLTVGTTQNTYRLTNAGSDDNASTTIASATGNTAGTVTYGFAASSNTAQGLMFNVANGTRHITRAALQVSGSNNTAGSEAGDLLFLTQTGGTAISEKMRIFGGGNVGIGTSTNNGFKLNLTTGASTGNAVSIFGIVSMNGQFTNLNNYGATENYYRTTNAGTDITPQLSLGVQSVNAGNVRISYGSTSAFNNNQLTFNVSNGTNFISRAALQVSGSNNTAGSEAGDLLFLTQTGGTAISEKMRITGAGAVSITGSLTTTSTGNFAGNLTVTNPSSIITAGGGNGLRLQIGNTTTYKTTNAGGAQTAQVIVSPNSNGAGVQGWGLDLINNPDTGMLFSAGNSSGVDQIVRASIGITNLINTAGAETGDLIISTKPTTTAIVERMRILGDSRLLYTAAFTATSTSQSYFLVTGSIRQVQTASAQIYGVNIAPTMIFTTGSQTQTALRVAPTFSGSAAFTASQQNIIADFGATSVGTQFSVNDVTSGSIYMVNDISGLPIIEALSDWTVNMYNYPTKVFQKSGSVITISGSLVVSPSSSFVLPLTASASPAVGSAYWSGSFLFIYNGTRYMSSSFA